MSYAKKQKKWIKKHDVKVGDFVNVFKQSGKDWVNRMNDSVGKIYEVVAFDDPNIFIILKSGFGYSRKSLKKVTDLKELAPFYVEIENEEQSRKAQEICFSHGIEKDFNNDFRIGTLEIRAKEGDLIRCIQYNDICGPWNFPNKENTRQLTYDKILRFENKQEEKEPQITEQKVNELIDKKIEELKQQIIKGFKNG